MSSKAMICNGCGKFSAPENGARIVDVGDGDGFLWTCPACVKRLTPKGFVPVYRETPVGFGD